ncbi:hypothetical protein PoMZ_03720, partial [Pyricularia oryzae]
FIWLGAGLPSVPPEIIVCQAFYHVPIGLMYPPTTPTGRLRVRSRRIKRVFRVPSGARGTGITRKVNKSMTGGVLHDQFMKQEQGLQGSGSVCFAFNITYGCFATSLEKLSTRSCRLVTDWVTEPARLQQNRMGRGERNEEKPLGRAQLLHMIAVATENIPALDSWVGRFLSYTGTR